MFSSLTPHSTLYHIQQFFIWFYFSLIGTLLRTFSLPIILPVPLSSLKHRRNAYLIPFSLILSTNTKIKTNLIYYNIFVCPKHIYIKCYTNCFIIMFVPIYRSCGNQLSLEVYNKTTTTNRRNQPPPRSISTPGVLSLAAGAVTQSDTTVSLQEPPRRRFHIPQVTFTSEVGSGVVV